MKKEILSELNNIDDLLVGTNSFIKLYISYFYLLILLVMTNNYTKMKNYTTFFIIWNKAGIKSNTALLLYLKYLSIVFSYGSKVLTNNVLLLLRISECMLPSFWRTVLLDIEFLLVFLFCFVFSQHFVNSLLPVLPFLWEVSGKSYYCCPLSNESFFSLTALIMSSIF